MLFTIGYTTFKSDDFIDVLKHYGINVVIDVRSLPYSRYHAQYDKEIVERILKSNKIYYRNYSNEFGARQTEQRYFSRDGYLDFELFTESKRFRHGFDKIKDSLTKGFNIVLMCAEKDPAVCHRSIMISRVFHNNGETVNHILADGNTESQNDIELCLLDKYFPDRNQLTLFGGPPIEQLIVSAYRKQNAEIGYRIGGNNG
ncbi:hypothetical protein R80B4_00173 [Fibrobacteres bacterium R8-0-B4]